MSRTCPEIVVLIPSYNSEKIIHLAIASLNASAEPHDIIVVDDGSRLPVAEHIPAQENMTVLRLDKNAGISGALNRGLEYALECGYTYIARLDTDDTVRPDRLSRQKEFLDSHPNIGLIGSWARIVDEAGELQYFYNTPLDYRDIAKELFYHNCMFHPSLMYRTRWIKDGLRYNSRFDGAEDWDFIRQIMKRTQVANIPEYLIDYTISLGGISQNKSIENMLRDFRVQLVHADFLSPHFYAGLGKTGANILRSALKFRKIHKIQAEAKISRSLELPIYARTLFRGMKVIGKKSRS